MFRAIASLLALCAALAMANAGKVSVETSSINGEAKVLVNGEPVEPGEREVAGSHVNYQRRTEAGTGGSCSYSSVRVSSTGGEPTNVNVQQRSIGPSSLLDTLGSGCGTEDLEDRFGSFAASFRRSMGSGGRAAWANDDDDDDSDDDDDDDFFDVLHRRRPRAPRHTHARDIRDRSFFDVENLVNELRGDIGSGGNGANAGNGNGGARRHADSNSGSGASGERREAHINGDGFYARARTSGNGAHHESVQTTTRRLPGGGVARVVSSSASASSSG